MSAIIMASFVIGASAQIRVTVNGRTVAMDTNPYIQNNHTMIPIRGVAETLGCDVDWNPKTRTVMVLDEETEITLEVDKMSAEVNGEDKPLDSPARIKNSRTYVPIRFVAEGLGADVSWNGQDKTVRIVKDGVIPEIAYAEDELLWLARIIHAEAEGEPFLGKVAVGNVVLNRVGNKEFPNTIYGVIFDRKNGTQFTPVANGKIYNNPSNECIFAADRALSGENVIGSSLYFCNPVISTNSWISNNRPFHTAIGKHYCYL